MIARHPALAFVGLIVGCARAPLPAPTYPLCPTPEEAFRKAPPAAPIDLDVALSRGPVIESATLSNGVGVWVARRPGVRHVSLSVVSRHAGVMNESMPPALTRLALRSTIEAGTVWTGHSVVEPPHVDGVGVELQIDALESSFHIRALSGHLGDALRVLARTVSSPAFDPAEFPSARAAELQRSQDASGQMVNTLLGIMLQGSFGASVAQRLAPSSGEELEHVTNDDLRRSYGALFNPGSSLLIAVGDITAAELTPLAERELGSWRHSEASGSAPPSFTPTTLSPDRLPASPRVHLLLQPDLGQAQLMLLQPAPGAKARDDELAFQLLAEIALGGRSRATTGLRHEAGVTYGIAHDTIPGYDMGLWLVQTSVETKETVTSLETLRQLLRDLQREPVGADELALAKVALSTRLARTLHNNSSLAQYLARSFGAGGRPDAMNGLAPALAALTPADVQRVARLYLRPDRLEIAVAGPPTLGEDLARIGELAVYHVGRGRPGEPPED